MLPSVYLDFFIAPRVEKHILVKSSGNADKYGQDVAKAILLTNYIYYFLWVGYILNLDCLHMFDFEFLAYNQNKKLVPWIGEQQ